MLESKLQQAREAQAQARQRVTDCAAACDALQVETKHIEQETKLAWRSGSGRSLLAVRSDNKRDIRELRRLKSQATAPQQQSTRSPGSPKAPARPEKAPSPPEPSQVSAPPPAMEPVQPLASTQPEPEPEPGPESEASDAVSIESEATADAATRDDRAPLAMESSARGSDAAAPAANSEDDQPRASERLDPHPPAANRPGSPAAPTGGGGSSQLLSTRSEPPASSESATSPTMESTPRALMPSWALQNAGPSTAGTRDLARKKPTSSWVALPRLAGKQHRSACAQKVALPPFGTRSNDLGLRTATTSGADAPLRDSPPKQPAAEPDANELSGQDRTDHARKDSEVGVLHQTLMTLDTLGTRDPRSFTLAERERWYQQRMEAYQAGHKAKLRQTHSSGAVLKGNRGQHSSTGEPTSPREKAEDAQLPGQGLHARGILHCSSDSALLLHRFDHPPAAPTINMAPLAAGTATTPR